MEDAQQAKITSPKNLARLQQMKELICEIQLMNSQFCEPEKKQ